MTKKQVEAIRERNEARRSAPVGEYDRTQAIVTAQTDIDALLAEIESLSEEIRVGDSLLSNRDKILDALPCPAHGRCVPYVLEKITALMTQNGPEVQKQSESEAGESSGSEVGLAGDVERCQKEQDEGGNAED